jgi:hypothetical protein
MERSQSITFPYALHLHPMPVRRLALTTVLSLMVITCGFVPRTAESQVVERFRGWAGAGHGSFGCWESFSCRSGDWMEARAAQNAFVGAAAGLNRFLEAGVELTSRAKDKGAMTIAMRTASAVAFVRVPFVSDLRLRGSIGRASRKLSGREDDIILDGMKDSGEYRSAGIVYDWRVLPRLSLTPGVEIGTIDFGDEKYSKMWEYRLGLTWR